MHVLYEFLLCSKSFCIEEEIHFRFDQNSISLPEECVPEKRGWERLRGQILIGMRRIVARDMTVSTNALKIEARVRGWRRLATLKT